MLVVQLALGSPRGLAGWAIVFTILGANVLLLVIDKRAITALGVDTSSLDPLLIPVYLFRRAPRTNGSHGPAYLWCILYCIVAIIEAVPDATPTNTRQHADTPPEHAQAPRQETIQNQAGFTWLEITENWHYTNSMIRPADGWRDVLVAVTVINSSSSQDTISVNPLDFFAEVDNASYRYDFNAERLIPDNAPRLPCVTLAPGGEAAGVMGFRVPAGGSIQMRWTPQMGSQFQIRSEQVR
jgi:hypothetical protein